MTFYEIINIDVIKILRIIPAFPENSHGVKSFYGKVITRDYSPKAHLPVRKRGDIRGK